MQAKLDCNPLFIGFGKQAQEYASVLKHYKIKISSVCVTNINKKKKIFKKFKIKNHYNNIDQALSEQNYNCIFIFLPFDLIEKKIIDIIKNSNVPIYCEKPISLSLKKIFKVTNILKKKKNKKFYILYNRNHYKIFKVLKSFLDKDKFKSEIFIPEKVKDTIKNININLKGKIKYHLTSHWLNFFFSLQNVKLIQPSYSKGSFYYQFKNTSIKITPNGKGRIRACYRSKKYILLLETLEKLTIFKINKGKLIKYKSFNEKLDNRFKPGVKNLIDDLLKNKIKNNTKKILDLYKSLEKLNF
jgi:hypothetical protein